MIGVTDSRLRGGAVAFAAIIVLVLGLFAATDAPAAPPTPVVIAKSGSSVPPKIRQAVVTTLERHLQTLALFYESTPPAAVYLFLADTPGEFARMAGADSSDVLAFAEGARNSIAVSPASWRGDPARLTSVLMHEASHIVLGAKFRATGAELPRWLDEGMAQYVASDWEFDVDWTAQQNKLMEEAVVGGRLVPLDRLGGLFGGSASEVQLAYAQSYGFVSYLASTHGQFALRAFLSAAAKPAVGTDQAARDVFSADLAHLEAAWRSSLEERTSWWDVLLDRSNLSVLLWSVLAVVTVLAFATVTYRKRRAYATMEESERKGRSGRETPHEDVMARPADEAQD